MKCGRCGATSDLIVHSRKLYKRTNEVRTYYYCRSCQKTRARDWYHRNKYNRMSTTQRLEKKEWKLVAKETENRLAAKYGPNASKKLNSVLEKL